MVELLPAGDERWLDVLEALSWQADWVVDHRADSNARLGIKAMRAIEDVLSSSVDPAARAMVKFRLANFLAWGVADLDAAERACEEARSLFDEAGVRAGALLAENELAWIHGLRSEYPAMQTVAERVLASAEVAGRSVRDDSSTDRAGTGVVLPRPIRGSRGPAPPRHRTR